MRWNVSLVARSPEEQQKCISEFNIDSGSVLLADDIRTHMREKNRRWVILAHDFSPPSQELWRQLPARSVFVFNEALLETAPAPLPFSRGALFMPTSITTLHAAAVFDILQRALNLVQKYPELANNTASLPSLHAETEEVNDIAVFLVKLKFKDLASGTIP
ncbi:polyketide synthase, putative [Aspergillus udagawae]|uniref:Polyketide synthase, putative n=1 Tax=Aspergillus udagawae TaxID=91492 RepID=A0A8H3NSY5_9EURO|nr:polyketide synthase, putative [Aspergillus udagawae]